MASKSIEIKNQIIQILKVQGVVPKMLVPFVWGPPGSGKSDLTEAIAKELDYQHIDIRLTHYDESVVCGYPYLEEGDYGKVMRLALPDWVTKAHNKPSVVVFDEINRANQNVRNAVLQILCERRLGSYVFPDHVKMIACGNLGDEDGTEVETLDDAHLNRFAHFKWEPKTDEWIKWARGNDLNPCIVSFYEVRQTSLYGKSEASKEAKSFSTPRTVTALCRLIDSMLKKEDREDWNKVKKLVDNYGFEFIGTSYKVLSKFLGEQATFSYKDILDRYSEVKKEVMKLESSRHSEFLREIKAYKFTEMTKKQVENLAAFLNDIRADESTGYVLAVAEELRGYNGDISDCENLKVLKKKCVRFFEALKEALDNTK